MQACPGCGSAIQKASAEADGSVVIGQPRYVRLTPEGKILIACPACGAELERPPAAVRLTLFRRRPRADRLSSK